MRRDGSGTGFCCVWPRRPCWLLYAILKGRLENTNVELAHIFRHCEKRSDEAIHLRHKTKLDCFAPLAMTVAKIHYSGSSGSRLALRRAVVAAAEVEERTKLQRIEPAARESCRITIWAVRRGPSLPARNTLSSRSTLSSGASKVQTSRFGSTSIDRKSTRLNSSH